MFPLSHMMKSFIRKGRLTVIDAEGRRHVFEGSPGISVTMRLTDPKLYKSLVFNPELAAGEAYMDGTMRFEEGSTLKDFLRLFSVNRLSLGSYPLQKVLRAIKMRFRKRQQSNRKGQAQQNVAHHYDLATISTNSSSMKTCSIPVPISARKAKRWNRHSATSCACWRPSFA